MVAPAQGREQQLEAVGRFLSRLDTGLGGSMLILGEAGLGKTRTLDRIATIAVRESAHVVRINADLLDSLAPLSTLIRGLSDPSNQLDASYLPTTATSGLWLVGDIQSMFERMSTDQCMVVEVDDVDRADDMSVHAVRLLIQALDTSPIIWALTARGGASARLAELRNTVVTNEGLLLQLAPLNEEESLDVVTRLLGHAPPEALVARASGAGGNPFLLTELVQGYREAEADLTTAHESQSLPERVREAARLRLASLTPEVIQILDVAAVVGRAFSVDDLVQPTGQSLAQVLTAIRQLQQLSVVVDTGDRFMFRHEILRESILADLPADIHRALHREVAVALLERGRPPADLAKHLLAGVGPHDAPFVEPLLQASERLASSAPSQAKQLATRALTVVEHDRTRWLDVVPRALAVNIAVTDLGAALTLLHTALDRGLGADDEAVARAQLCDALWRAGRTKDAVDTLTPVLGRSDLSPGSMLRLDVALARTKVLGAGSGPAEAAALLGKVVTEARQLGERDTVSYALAARSMALRFLGEIETSIEVAREAVSFLGGREWRGADPRIWLARSLLAADRLDEAETLCGRILSSISGPASSRDLPLVSATLARVLMARGRVLDVVTEANSGIAAMETAGGRELAADLIGCAAIAAWLNEGTEEAHRLIDRASAYTANNSFGMNHLELARLIIGENEPTRTQLLAAPVLDQLDDSYGQLIFDPMHAPALVHRLLTAGVHPSAEVVSSAAQRLSRQNGHVVSWAASAQHAAALLHRDGEEMLEAATRFDESGRPLAAALARADAVEVFQQRTPSMGRALLGRVVDDLRELGASAAAERTARLGSGGRRSRRPAPRAPRPLTGWDALTPAELRVVELAARGATNKEIAKELWISPYTVDTHMRHSLAKLGLRSRVALARLAAERQAAPPEA